MDIRVGDIVVCADGREFRLTEVTDRMVATAGQSGCEPRDLFERGVTSGRYRWMKRDIAHLKAENERLKEENERLSGLLKQIKIAVDAKWALFAKIGEID